MHKHHVEGTDGPPVTIISTVFYPSIVWKAFTRGIAKEHRLITYDLDKNDPVSFNEHPDAVADILASADVDSTYLIGMGCGALICREIALRYPDMVRGLALVAPSFNPWRSQKQVRILRSWRYALTQGGPKQMWDTMYMTMLGDRAQGQGGAATYVGLREGFVGMSPDPQVGEAALDDMIDWLTNAASDAATLPLVEAPTLLMAGDDDTCMSPTGIRAIAEMMPNARVEIFDGCGHALFMEDTERFEHSVCEFIAEVEKTW